MGAGRVHGVCVTSESERRCFRHSRCALEAPGATGTAQYLDERAVSYSSSFERAARRCHSPNATAARLASGSSCGEVKLRVRKRFTQSPLRLRFRRPHARTADAAVRRGTGASPREPRVSAMNMSTASIRQSCAMPSRFSSITCKTHNQRPARDNRDGWNEPHLTDKRRDGAARRARPQRAAVDAPSRRASAEMSALVHASVDRSIYVRLSPQPLPGEVTHNALEPTHVLPKPAQRLADGRSMLFDITCIQRCVALRRREAVHDRAVDRFAAAAARWCSGWRVVRRRGVCGADYEGRHRRHKGCKA